MNHAEAAEFVAHWLADWNAHDLEALLSHYHDDVVFTSPAATLVLDGSDGILRGKTDLRRYWGEGLRVIGDLHFEVVGHYVGVDTLVINYRNQKAGMAAEVLTFKDGLVVTGHGTYLSGTDNPAGIASG
jgi:ketosteroid isomerase-like protein